MWLAQFVCAPQFFKTPSGLCGHAVYFSIMFHSIVQWVLQVMLPSACSTKQTIKKKREADKIRYARNSNINEENRTEKKHKWKSAKRNHVQVKPANQIPSGI
jgi:hypothetical protein